MPVIYQQEQPANIANLFHCYIIPRMSMPTDLVLIRHGFTEANYVQQQRKAEPDFPSPEGFENRPDRETRLADLGRDQAEQTGAWIRAEFPRGFHRQYTSSDIRAIETAGHLALSDGWYIDPRLVERRWGEYADLTGSEREEEYARSTRLRRQSKWDWCPPGGESLASGVMNRWRDFQATLHRELGGKAVACVMHGESMQVARAVIERMLPTEWDAEERAKVHDMANCQVVHYTRRNPADPTDVRDHLEWRRSVCVWDPEQSWDNGEWVHIDHKRTFTTQQLLDIAGQYPLLLGEE